MAANANFTALTSASVDEWLNTKFADAVFDGRPGLAWIKKNGRYVKTDPAPKLVEPVLYQANGTGTWHSTGYEESNFTPQDGLNAAEFNLKLYTATCVFDEFTLIKNSGPNQKIDLWEAKIMQAKESIMDDFNEMFFGDGTADVNSFVGLNGIIADTGTYGNIARSGNTWWQSYVEDTTRVLNEDDMRTAVNTANRNRPDGIDLIITTQSLFEKYESLLVPAIRKSDTRVAELGFDSLQFKGIPMTWDADCPADTMFFINSKWLKLRYVKDFEWTPDRTPTKQFVKAKICRWIGAMTCNNPRYQAKLTNRTGI